jgi:nicotinamidase-related amidase
VTLDTHDYYDIAHPVFWKNTKGESPSPFTKILNKDIKKGKWIPTNPLKMDYVLKYTKFLEEKGLYELFIWPPHCLLHSEGHEVVSTIKQSLLNWEKATKKNVGYICKGQNPYTEHYGAFEAEFPIEDDVLTQKNIKFIKQLKNASKLIITGQALSHCVASTVRQLIEELTEEEIKNLYFLEDASSSVSGFEEEGVKFIEEIKFKGVNIIKSTVKLI